MEKDGLFIQKAAAGSGKTTSLIERVTELLIDEHETGLIAVATYTREGALVIHQRIASYGGSHQIGKRLIVGTLHSIAGRALNHFRRHMNMPPLKIHGDGRSSMGLIEIINQETARQPQIVAHLKTAGNFGDSRSLAARLTCLMELLPSDCLYSLDEIAPYFQDTRVAQFSAGCLGRWQREMADAQFSDYTRILPEVTGMMRRYRNNKHLLAPLDVVIDEFQDLSPRQLEFVDVLCRRARSLFAVGCPDQSIYDFRAGGRVSFDRFPATLRYSAHLTRQVRTVPALDFSYRCPQGVAQASASLLGCNAGGMSVPMRGHDNGVVSVGWFHDETSEVETIAGSLSRMPANSYGNTAILGRTHQAVEPFFLALVAKQVPVRMMRGDDPVGALVLGRIGAWLRVSQSPADVAAAKQILRAGIAGIGPATLTKLEKNLTGHDAVYRCLAAGAATPGLKRPQVAAVIEVARQLEEASKILKREGDLIHWLQWVHQNRSEHLATPDLAPEEFRRAMDFAFRLARACQTPGRFLDALAEPTHSAHVNVGTFHASKGHGWDTVFIVAASRYNMEGLHQRCQDKLFATGVLDGGLDEERRLLHVGMSRAAQNLIVTWAGGPQNSSSFIRQAGLNVADHSGIVIPRLPANEAEVGQKPATMQLALF